MAKREEREREYIKKMRMTKVKKETKVKKKTHKKREEIMQERVKKG